MMVKFDENDDWYNLRNEHCKNYRIIMAIELW